MFDEEGRRQRKAADEGRAVAGFVATAVERGALIDLHLLDHEALDTELRYSHEGRAQGVRLAWEPPFSTLVLWSVAGKDYLCVEPWTAPGDALNTHAGLVELAPGETLRTAFTFAPLG